MCRMAGILRCRPVERPVEQRRQGSPSKNPVPHGIAADAELSARCGESGVFRAARLSINKRGQAGIEGARHWACTSRR